MSAEPAPAAARRAAVRITRVEGALDAHKQVDELRFNALSAAMLKLEAAFDALQGEVRDGFERLGGAVHQIQLHLAAEDDAAAKGHWRIGPFGQWAMGLAALAAIALIGWLATQLWLEEPARIRATPALPAVAGTSGPADGAFLQTHPEP